MIRDLDNMVVGISDKYSDAISEIDRLWEAEEQKKHASIKMIQKEMYDKYYKDTMPYDSYLKMISEEERGMALAETQSQIDR